MASSFSEPSTSGQTKNAWRPSRSRSRTNSYAPSRFSSPTAQVFTGRRPAGSSRSVVASRSPYAVSESVRGIGVAVMWRTCGAARVPSASSGPLASSAARWRDAEAVLLVDDADREPREAHVRLDQRVGADDEAELAGLEPAERVAARRRLRGAGEERERDVGRGEEAVERVRVLLGERLGRRHERGLVARLDRAEHRVDGNDRLAGAHLAHQEALHRAARGEVLVDLGERLALARRSARTEARRARPASARRADRAERRAACPRGPCAVRRARPGGGRAPRRRAGAARLSASSARPGKWAAASASATAGRPCSARTSAGSGSIASRARPGAAPDPLAHPVGAQAVGDRVDRARARRCGCRARARRRRR